MGTERDGDKLHAQYRALQGALNEASRRRWAASAALHWGRGGIAAVARVTGLSRPTIRRGIHELRTGTGPAPGRIRRPGGGRRPLTQGDPSLLLHLDSLLQSRFSTPQMHCTPLTLQRLQRALRQRDHVVSLATLSALCADRGYRSYGSGSPPSDRTARLRWLYLQARVQQFTRLSQPVLFLDLALRRPPPHGNPISWGIRTPQPHRSVPAGPPCLRDPEELSAPQLASQVLRGLVLPHTPKALEDATHVLILVGEDRPRAQPVGWQQACRLLAAKLGRSVQILLLPPGLYRWHHVHARWLNQLVHIDDQGRARAIRVELGILSDPARNPPVWRVMRRPGRAPQRLIDAAPVRHRGDSPWSFCAIARSDDS